MHKRILSFLLAALLLLSLIPVFALPSGAVSNMRTSEACIVILKELEGFSQFPYFDETHYSVGYGSSCQEGDYPNGITEEEADALLREFISDMENDLNIFANRYNIPFSRYQFDALMLFTYNCGAGWVYNDELLRQAVIDNAPANDFLYPFTLWSAAGGKTNMGLVNRRLREANMYLNGIYAAGKPANFTYAFYDNNGGEGRVRIHGYDSNQPAQVKARPTREGYVLLGWYTAPEGGEWVRSLTVAHSQKTIYAHWQLQGALPGSATAASYEIPAGELLSQDLYSTPGGTVLGTMALEDTALVDGDYVDADGVKWGHLTGGQWVKLGDSLVGIPQEAIIETGLPVKVTGDFVNVRTGPGTTYGVVGLVSQDATVYLTRVVSVDGVLWGKCRAGWLCLQYTDYAGGLTVEEPGDDLPQIPGTPEVPKKSQKPAETVIATGTVMANQMYIRATAGSNGSPVGSYRQGDRIELLEKTTINGVSWGRTDQGWISLTYVLMDQDQQWPVILPLEITEPKVPETTVPEKTEPMEADPQEVGKPGVVASKTELNIRSGAGTDCEIVGSYESGQRIHIREQISLGGVIWGRTDLGWVCMQYVSMDDENHGDTEVYGIVCSQTGLNIRSGAGVGYAPTGTYADGSRIQILEQVSLAGQKWGRTALGWVCMDQVRLEAKKEAPAQNSPETTAAETTVPETTVPVQTPEPVEGIIIADGVNIRRSPGTNGLPVGSYHRDDRVTILEKRQANGSLWGRTNRGWISLAYVELENPEVAEYSFTGKITADLLCVRQGPGTGNAIVGTYRLGQKVTILEEIRVGITLWGRTDKGWICMDYVK